MEHQVLTIPDEPSLDPCWNRIGIYGSRDCPELDAHSHCRNCPTYAHKAALLLDRALPDAHDMGAALPALLLPGEPTQSLMLLRLGAEWFALPTLVLDEIVGPRVIHALPHRRDPGLLGLVNVRGELVICVSLAQVVLGAQSPPASAQAGSGMMMVARHDGGRFAFPVDEVAQTIHRAPSAHKPVPATLARAGSSFTRGVTLWRDRPVGCLDAEALFKAFERCLS